MTKAMEIRGLIEDETGRTPFLLRISEPEEQPDGEYCCTVDFSPEAVDISLKISGIDAKQARELSLEYIRWQLSDERLFHSDGRPMKINRPRKLGK
jgi:hypothetical protein